MHETHALNEHLKATLSNHSKDVSMVTALGSLGGTRRRAGTLRNTPSGHLLARDVCASYYLKLNQREGGCVWSVVRGVEWSGEEGREEIT